MSIYVQGLNKYFRVHVRQEGWSEAFYEVCSKGNTKLSML